MRWDPNRNYYFELRGPWRNGNKKYAILPKSQYQTGFRFIQGHPSLELRILSLCRGYSQCIFSLINWSEIYWVPRRQFRREWTFLWLFISALVNTSLRYFFFSISGNFVVSFSTLFSLNQNKKKTKQNTLPLPLQVPPQKNAGTFEPNRIELSRWRNALFLIGNQSG